MKKMIAILLALVLVLSLSACGKKNKDLVVTVITKDGVTEQTTRSALREQKTANPLAYEKKYDDAKVTLESVVTRIEGAHTMDGAYRHWTVYCEDGWSISRNKYNKQYDLDTVVENLNAGDKVKVSGEFYYSVSGMEIVNGTLSIKKIS